MGIREFFAGKNVLLTGTTGFLGELNIELKSDLLMH